MSTRVTSAASKRAKETLIQLLFPQQQAKRYTHLQLRMAYLQRVHIMHPDKQRSTSESSIRDKAAHEKFVELQNAWEAYNLSARMFLQTTNAKSKQGENLDDDGNHDDFIMFGVGCSFSDSPEEKELRNEIMEQACKGWFPSGALSHSDGGEVAKVEVKSYTKLSDDDMFMQQQTSEAFSSTNLHDVQTKKSLVQNVENYRNRRRRNR